MRARYSAFVTGRMNGDFVRNTTAPEMRSEMSGDPSPQIGSMGLEIRRITAGGSGDQTGTVEFIAHLLVNGRPEIHHEVSRFRRDSGQWVYIDGRFPSESGSKRISKVGRNDPCPCGSGKKYKHCCGK
jgi:SEC-C motif-containing protein